MAGSSKHSDSSKPEATKSVPEVSIQSKIPAYAVDGHRFSVIEGQDKSELEFWQYTGNSNAIVVSSIRLPLKHARILANGILEELTRVTTATTSDPSTNNKRVQNAKENNHAY